MKNDKSSTNIQVRTRVGRALLAAGIALALLAVSAETAVATTLTSAGVTIPYVIKVDGILKF